MFAALLAEWFSWLNFNRQLADMRSMNSDQFSYMDTDGVHRHLPDKTGYSRSWNDQGKVEVRINSLGFRGGELSLKKEPGIFRILFLGDSITFGSGLREEDVFVYRIGQKLNAASAADYEVVNAGVIGVGLTEEIQILRTTGLKIDPDLILLNWYLNDGRPPRGFPREVVYNNPLIHWLSQQHWLRKSYLVGFVYDTARRLILEKQLNLLDSEQRRFTWLKSYFRTRWEEENPATFARYIRWAKFDWGDAWNPASRDKMLRQIREIKKLCDAHGANLALVAFPVQAQVYLRSVAPVVDEPQRIMSSFCQSEGIPFLDLLPVLRTRREEVIFYDSCHYTPHGNSIISSTIFNFILETNLVPISQQDRSPDVVFQ